MRSKKTGKRIIKIEVTKNYVIEDYRNPPNVIKFVKKEIVDRDGYRDLVTLAIVKDPKTGETKTVATSFWRPINKPSAKRLVRDYLKKYPNKVKFLDPDKKHYFLNEITTHSLLEFLDII